jgi:hypothetical protein
MLMDYLSLQLFQKELHLYKVSSRYLFETETVIVTPGCPAQYPLSLTLNTVGSRTSTIEAVPIIVLYI